jgi:hypothetical protein
MIALNVIKDGRTHSLDLYGETKVSLNFQVSDIRDFDKRSASFSKSIVIPGTKNNNNVFDNIAEPGIDVSSYNPHKFMQAQLTANGLPVFDCVLQLDEVLIRGNKIEYRVVLFGQLIDFSHSLGERRLTDLDFSDMNHTFTKQNVKNSWNNMGFQYVYPLEDRGVHSGKEWHLSSFRPAIFVREYVKRIFQQAGFRYKSNFLDSDYFKKLIVPCPKMARESLLFRASRDTSNKIAGFNSDGQMPVDYSGFDATTFNYGPNGSMQVFNSIPAKVHTFPNKTTGVNFDGTGSSFDTTNGKWKCPQTGTYRLHGQVQTRVHLKPNFDSLTKTSGGSTISGVAGWAAVPLWVNRHVRLMKGNTSLWGHLDTVSVNNPDEVINAHQGKDFFGITRTFDFVGHFVKDEEVDVQITFQVQSSTYDGQHGTMIRKMTNTSSSHNNKIVTGVIEFFHQPGGFYMNTQLVSGSEQDLFQSEGILVQGNTVNMNNMLPDSSQKDFIKNIFKMFNLMVMPDKEDPYLLVIEPMDDFYRMGKKVDWTDKLNRTAQISHRPLVDLDFNELIFKYKEDGDWLPKKFVEHFDRSFGERRVIVGNDFLVNNVKTIDFMFSSTPAHPHLWNSTRYIPSYLKEGKDKLEQNPPKMKILFYGGQLPLSGTANTWQLRDSSGVETINVYPYTGHFDHPTHPSADLNFGPCVHYWTPNVNYTDGNVYNMFWKSYVDNIINKDSKMLTGYFTLTVTDILNFDFRDTVLVDGIAYWVNKIMDYNPDNPGMTKVELFRVM